MVDSDHLEITPTAFAYGGDCIGKLSDGRAVFIPLTLPGERVRIRLVEEKRSHAKAELLEILAAAPGRITPRCPHHAIAGRQAVDGGLPCAGCCYQHMPYAMQLAAKNAILRDHLERIGGMQNSPIKPPALLTPFPEGEGGWNYRNQFQFLLTPEGRLAMPAAAPGGGVVLIQECHLPEAPLNELWPMLDLEAIPGLEAVSLRLGADGDAMLILESSDPQPPEMTVEDLPISVVHLSPVGALVLAGSDHVVMELRGRPFRVSAASSFPANTAITEAMVEHLLDKLPLSHTATLLDLYCGVGLFSASFAPKVGRLIGVEASPAACEDFAINLNEFDNVELYEADVENALPALGAQPDGVIVAPSRTGLARRTLEALLALGAPALAYLSCDPATLARDAKRLLENGYRLESVTLFDMQPQTYHIESISVFQR